jgi:glucose-1-phosphate cytidylyltransferase
MKVVILAGGKGTRISEESRLRPKPMVEIGGKPILWHIMRQYAFFGFREFVICCGYKGHMIKEYFVNYYQHNCQLEIHLTNQKVQILRGNCEPWKVTMVDTGLETLTAGRILKARR